MHPDALVFGLLANGFSTVCFDGQYFFDTDHPVRDNNPVSASNTQGGSGTGWYLLDCSKPMRPLIFQERMLYMFTALNKDVDENVFMRDEYIYGVRARCNAGYGLWQLAYGSQQDLNSDNYAAARAAMQSFVADNGRPLGITPTHLVFPPALEVQARTLIKAERDAAGATNVWKDSAEMLNAPTSSHAPTSFEAGRCAGGPPTNPHRDPAPENRPTAWRIAPCHGAPPAR